MIAEGIESALSGQQETGFPVRSAISASNMTNLVLPEPPLANVVIIAAYGDATGFNAAQQSASKWVQQGRRVRIPSPLANRDLNDLLRGDR